MVISSVLEGSYCSSFTRINQLFISVIIPALPREKPRGHAGWAHTTGTWRPLQHGQAARSQPSSIGRDATSTPRLHGPRSGSARGQLCPGGCTLWAAGSLEGGSSQMHSPQCDSPIHKTIPIISAKSEISQGEIATGLSLLHELQEMPCCPSPSTGKVFLHAPPAVLRVCLWLLHRNPKHPVEWELSASRAGAFQLFTTCTQQKSTQQHPFLADTQHPEDTGC